MNQSEQRAGQQRNATMRSSMAMWSAAGALVVVVLLILGLTSSAPAAFFKKGAVAAAILLLLIRQIGRRLQSRNPRAARPDPQSTLKLD